MPAAAHANAFDDALKEYRTTGAVDGCKHTAGELAQAKAQMPKDIAQTAPGFPAQLAAAAAQRAKGCTKAEDARPEHGDRRDAAGDHDDRPGATHAGDDDGAGRDPAARCGTDDRAGGDAAPPRRADDDTGAGAAHRRPRPPTTAPALALIVAGALS